MLGCSTAGAAEPVEPGFFRDAVAREALPPVAERIPATPSVVSFADGAGKPGRHGGDLNMLIGRAKDVRLMVVRNPKARKLFRRAWLCSDHVILYAESGYDTFEIRRQGQ